jgi:hypothetical protein
MPYEGVPKLQPIVDPPPGEVLEPSARRVGKVQWDALDDEQVVSRSAVVSSEAVILEPDAQVGLSIVLRDRGRSTISSWWDRSENYDTKSSWTSGIKRWTSTYVFVAA